MAGCIYVEPFAGGAGAGLGLLVTGQVSHVVINDLDPAIYAFWRLVHTSPDSLISKIMSVPLDVGEWRKQKTIYANAAPEDIDELGFATFYLNRTNRSGVLNGGPIGGRNQNGNFKIDARFNRPQLAKRIELLALYASQITVTARDGVDVISNYAGQQRVFVYADPPYFEKAGSLYMNAFRLEDHERLAGVLNGFKDATWLLTYDNSAHVPRLYAERRRRIFELRYSANGASTAKEIAILSDGMADIPDGWELGSSD